VRADDPMVFALSAAALLSAALAAGLIPAWRAARIDPIRALRWE
jgi:ABC-type antimicrobial peptide transport system permease subunit